MRNKHLKQQNKRVKANSEAGDSIIDIPASLRLLQKTGMSSHRHRRCIFNTMQMTPHQNTHLHFKASLRCRRHGGFLILANLITDIRGWEGLLTLSLSHSPIMLNRLCGANCRGIFCTAFLYTDSASCRLVISG